MTFNLDRDNFEIFLSLLQDPIRSERSISKETGISLPKVKNQLSEFKLKKFLRTNKEIYDPVLGNRLQTDVEGLYQPQNVGLAKIYVFFTDISTSNNVFTIRTVLDSHPYCHYFSNCHGTTGVIFAIFHSPLGTDSLINDFCKKIASENNCNLNFLSNSTVEGSSQVDFSQWDILKQVWSVTNETTDKISHLSGIQTPDNILEQSINYFLDNQSSSNQSNISDPMSFQNDYSQLDMALLREISINGKISLKSLTEIYDLDRSTIYRHKRKLEESVISDYVLYFNNAFFDITTDLLLYGSFKPNSSISARFMADYLMSSDFPFQSSFVSNKKDFIWHINTTPFFLTEIIDFSWSNFDLQHSLLNNPKTSFRYFFPSNNYLPEKKWKQDKGFLLKLSY